MFTNAWFTLNRYTALMPKLRVTPKSENIDVTALLKKNCTLGAVENTENSKADTVEISDTAKKTDTRKKPDTSVLRPETEELVNYVREQAERRKPPPASESYKPPSPEDIKRQRAEAEETARSRALAAKFQRIDAKMRSGRLPNAEEMDFLREHNPKLYMEAKRMEMEIEQFRSQLKNCKTKEEKTRLVLIKKSMLAQEAKTILKASNNKEDPVIILCIMAAIDREFQNDSKNNDEPPPKPIMSEAKKDPNDVQQTTAIDEEGKESEEDKQNTETSPHTAKKDSGAKEKDAVRPASRAGESVVSFLYQN